MEYASKASSGLWKKSKSGAVVSGPRCILLHQDAAHEVPMDALNIEVDVHLAVAFVQLECVFKVNQIVPAVSKSEKLSFVFELPTQHDTSVTSTVIFLANNQIVEAIVVEDTPGLLGYRNREGAGMAQAMRLYRERSGRKVGMFDPELFAIPFHGATVGEEIKVVVKYMQNMEFQKGEFTITLPLRLKPEFFDSSVTIDKRINLEYRVSCAISDGSVVDAGSRSHHLLQIYKEQHSSSNKVALYNRDMAKPWKNANLELHYSTSALKDIVASALYRKSLRDPKAKKGSPDEGVMSVFLAPPREVESLTAQPKDVVFVLDRSGSMGFADVMDDAKQALIQGLSELNSNDRFAICAFDDKQLWFAGALPEPDEATFSSFMARLQGSEAGNKSGVEESVTGTTRLQRPEDVELSISSPEVQEISRERNPLISASTKNLEKAKVWVSSITPGGLTDIMTPLRQATYALHSHRTRQQMKHGISTDRVSMVFLVTDGAVQNERDICRFGQMIAGTTRIFTFGIGQDCNAYFLRKLASIGRGYTDVALVKNSTKSQITRLISHAQLPILTDVSLSIDSKGLVSHTWTPASTPDLFYNSPIMISMKYKGELAEGSVLTISGTLSGSSGKAKKEWSRQITVKQTSVIPLQKVFAQQHVQELVADAWLADLAKPEGKALREEAVSVAVSESISCAFTKVVAAESSAKDYEERKKTAEEAKKKGFKPSPTNISRFKQGIVFLGAAGAMFGVGAIAAALTPGIAETQEVAVCCDECDAEMCEGCDCVG